MPAEQGAEMLKNLSYFQEVNDRKQSDAIPLATEQRAVRDFVDTLDVTQGKLTLGFRLGRRYESPSDVAKLMCMNAIFGGSTTSKLFLYVREELSLCYYASSAVRRMQGVMFVASGVAFADFERARDAILEQLDAVKKGDFSEEEFESAKRYMQSVHRQLADTMSSIQDYMLMQALTGLDAEPSVLADEIAKVSREDICTVAQGISLDSIYYMRGKEEVAV